jgi:hypothetical protein
MAPRILLIMNPSKKPVCCCGPEGNGREYAVAVAKRESPGRYMMLGIAGLLVWWLIYRSLASVAAWSAYSHVIL